MKIHYFRHVPFEYIGAIEDWANSKNHKLTSTEFYQNENLPKVDEIDLLIVMGGPMNIYEEEKFPWLKKEKEFIKNFIETGKPVLGICLGSQLIADVLGAKVKKNLQKEIGWHKIKLTDEAIKSGIFGNEVNEFRAFHWHEDTFELPENSILLASSKACKNQAFIFKEKILGLQFHLEMTEFAAKILIENSKNDFDDSKFVQSENEILSAPKEGYEAMNNIIFSVLNYLEKFSHDL